jgi:hypothetical protein
LPSSALALPQKYRVIITTDSFLRAARRRIQMAWFRNHYVCLACEGHWLAEHAEAIEADCPFCRAYDVAPYKSRRLDADRRGGRTARKKN